MPLIFGSPGWEIRVLTPGQPCIRRTDARAEDNSAVRSDKAFFGAGRLRSVGADGPRTAQQRNHAS